MSELISLVTAAQKYGIKKETIYLWAKLDKIGRTTKRGDEVWVSDKNLEEYLHWRKKCDISADYVDELEMFCYNQTMTNDMFRGIMRLQKKQISLQQERIAELEEIKNMVDEEIDHTQATIKTILSHLDKIIVSYDNTSWITRLWKRISSIR